MAHKIIAKSCAVLSIGILAACGNAKSKAPVPVPGKVAIKTSLEAQGASNAARHAREADGTTPPPVCGTFTLQPYSLDTSGNMTLAGDPVTFSTNINSAGTTNEILGCIDSGNSGNDWGYVVTANAFNDCGTPSAAIPGLSPSTATIQVAFKCAAGVDTEVPITIDVSIAQPDSAGYVDISAGVNASDVQTGCKQADIGATDGMVHYGESYIDDTGAVHTGLVGLSTGSPTQYGGTVNDPAGDVDTYYTGQFDPSVTGDTQILQTFADTCSGANQEYVDINHAECLTNFQAKGGVTLDTEASLAGIFLAEPGVGFVSATLDDGVGIQFFTYLGAPAFMDATQSPTVLGFNSGMYNWSYDAPNGYTLTGLFIDQSTLFGIVAVGTDGSGTPVYTELTANQLPNAITWVPGTWNPISTLSAAQQSTLGLFTSTTGCITITPNIPYCGGSGTERDPYLICDSASFEQIATSSNASSSAGGNGDSTTEAPDTLLYFSQTTDFTLASSWVPFNFYGNYEGNNHTITYSYSAPNNTNDYNYSWIGLFADLNYEANVQDLKIQATLSASQYVGILAGVTYGDDITVSNVHVSGSVIAFWQAGGLIGSVYDGNDDTFQSVSSSAQVTSTAGATGACNFANYGAAGGLIGSNGATLTINDCAVSGDVSTSGGNSGFGGGTGGIVGAGATITLNNCLFTGTLPIAADQTCPGAVSALLGNDEGGNVDNDSLWSIDTAGCTASGCAASGFATDGPASAGETSAMLEDPANYLTNYPTTWDFTNNWLPPDGTNAAMLR